MATPIKNVSGLHDRLSAMDAAIGAITIAVAALFMKSDSVIVMSMRVTKIVTLALNGERKVTRKGCRFWVKK